MMFNCFLAVQVDSVCEHLFYALPRHDCEELILQGSAFPPSHNPSSPLKKSLFDRRVREHVVIAEDERTKIQVLEHCSAFIRSLRRTAPTVNESDALRGERRYPIRLAVLV